MGWLVVFVGGVFVVLVFFLLFCSCVFSWVFFKDSSTEQFIAMY